MGVLWLALPPQPAAQRLAAPLLLQVTPQGRPGGACVTTAAHAVQEHGEMRCVGSQGLHIAALRAGLEREKPAVRVAGGKSYHVSVEWQPGTSRIYDPL